jgi:hypothetical protein
MQGGQHVSRRQHRAAGRAADRKDLRRITTISAVVVAGVALATAGVAGTSGAGSAVAVAYAPVGAVLLDGPNGAVTAPPTTAPAGQPDAAQPNAAQPNAAPPSAAPNAAPQTPQETPELRITLAYERHDRDLVITLTFAGYVFRPYSTKTGQIEEYPIPAKRDIGIYEHLDWGDGTSYTAPTKAQRCALAGEKRMVHEVADRYQLKKKYRKGGDYTINYEYDACGLTNGKIAGQLKMHVP